MLENGLFLLLGLLLAALIALLIAPAIWRRAVTLTRRRIESNIPLTLDEIQGEKDQLRAKFAMQARRLEVSLEALNEKANKQFVQLNRQRDTIFEREEQLTSREQHIAELDQEIARLTDQLNTRTAELEETAQQLSRTQERLLEKGEALTDLLKRHSSLIDDVDNQKIEMAANTTRVESLRDEKRELSEKLKELRTERTQTRSELKASDAAYQREKKRVGDREEEIARLRSQQADLETRLERRDADLARLRGKENAPPENDELNRLREENDQLRQEAGDMRSRLETMFDNSARQTDNTKLLGRIAELQEITARLTSERDALREQSNGDAVANGDGDIARADYALVRDKIADLAARFTAMAASREGVDSPLARVLETKEPNGADDDDGTESSHGNAETPSLLDRVHDIQHQSENA